MKSKKKSAKKRVSAIKPSDYMELYRAVEKYVSTRGGYIAVISGIQVIQWPGESEHNFTLGIRCIGRKPKYRDKP